jgi:4-amino-4-deoxy-L-arabinose transferase-like glycosyltransferase
MPIDTQPSEQILPSKKTGTSRSVDLWIVLIVGVLIYAGTLFAPPSLMDDVDAVNAQIAREMLTSGDWVTAHINGVIYLEKSPLKYWMIAACFSVFGIHDWVARLPIALGCIGLMLMTTVLGRWGWGRQAGLYSGLAAGCCCGLFLFTRILIPDVLLTLSITVALYCFMRTMVDGKPRWIWGFWAALGIGMLFKGLLAALVPIASAGLYLLIRRRLFSLATWRLLRPFSGACVTSLIFLPWVALAAWRNPPVWDFTLHSDPGVYRGFLWFYFINEHILRFLNLRFPRDYNTVPRLPFLLLHLVWIFPWSVFLPAAFKTQPAESPNRARELWLLCMIWIVFLLTFLSFSTTQEYYSLPCYPAFALLAGSALALGPRRWIAAGYGLLAALGILFAIAASIVLYFVWGLPAPGDISSALTSNPDAYTLSLGHMQDLTLPSFAYLRGPLLLAAVAFGAGSVVAWICRRKWAGPLCLAAMMVLFFHAARWAMAVFDPYLSSRPLAQVLETAPPGQLILEGHFYPFSSVGFYTQRPVLLLNGKADNLIYGAAAPHAPNVFLTDAELAQRWKEPQRLYLVAWAESRPRLEKLVPHLNIFASSGGKFIFSNQP